MTPKTMESSVSRTNRAQIERGIPGKLLMRLFTAGEGPAARLIHGAAELSF